jgi:hypothetical protein
MAGDYSKIGFAPLRRVSTVLLQQGRVTLDSDTNEQGEVLDRRIGNLARDVWGRAWVPALTTPDAFRLTPVAGPDLAIGAGRLYAQGLAPEVFPGEAPTWQQQPFVPIAQPLPAAGHALAYLDVFEREITWVEEPALLEKALYGVDSSARRQVLWQVKLQAAPNASCATDLDALFPPSHGRLTTDATGTPASDDPCILPPEGGYRGLENRLYRVQVHVPGPPGTARFKWSRENASVVSPVEAIQSSGTSSQVQVTRIGRDAVLRFAPGDWVEVTDDWRDWLGDAGDMARIDTIDEATRTIFLDRVVPASGTTPFAPDAAGHQARHTKLIRWDQSLERHGNAVDPGTGLMIAGAFPIALEDGVQVGFEAAAGTSGAMRIGDHWSFTARTVDGSVQQLDAAPPDGVRHVYVPLAVVNVGAAGITVISDCRNLVPPRGETRPERVCECCTICVGEGGQVPDLKTAMAALPNLAPDPATAVRICLLPGDHEIGDGLDVDRPNTWIVGCLPRSRLHVRGAGLRFSANLTGLEEVVLLGAAERGMVAFRGVEDGLVRRCWFESDGGGPFAVVAEATRRLTIEDSRLTGAGLGLLGGCREVRVRGNAVERFASSAIAIDGAESQDIEIRRNRLVDGLGSGIEVISHPERLAIVDNEIATCRGEKNTFGGVAGGIVILEAVDDLSVRDNRITGNAGDARADAAGVYVARGSGVEIARNRIEGNGRAEIDGQPIAGGIVIDAVQARRDPAGNERHRFDPALVVADNVVLAPRGHALFVIGEGDIRVQDNSLISQLGVARSAGPDDLGARDAAAVVLIGTPRLDGLARILIAAGVQGPNAPLEVSSVAQDSPALGRGRVMLQDNQIGLERQLSDDRTRPTLSAVAIYGFTDVDLARNQLELERSAGSFCLDALVVALTTRQQGNRLTEREGACLASLLSVGFALNTCSQNQGSHCILPFSPQKLAASDNLVEFPSDLCREG